ncbi:MAG: ATP-dependent DNA helicase RecG [Clostridiales bacterium]|nr:ATP-dependent DNA helicase RecG [Clostridiales bacterium]
MELQDSITTLKGVGPKKAEAFARLGVNTVEDLIFTFPRIYEDRKDIKDIAALKEGEAALFAGAVDAIRTGGFTRGRRSRVLRMLVTDNTGSIEVVFFNAAYLAKTIKRGDRLAFFGKPVMNRDRLQVVHPQFEKEETVQTGILPIYPLTSGVTQREMRRLQKLATPLYGQVESILSEETVRRNNLCDLEYAIRNVHFPEERQHYLEAKYRLVFDEFMALETGLMASKMNERFEGEGTKFLNDGSEEEFIKSLPYPLTRAQQRCVEEITADLISAKPMNRLIQGDVGSGKTVVAQTAMYKAVRSGYQAAMMAPTEILARQHYEGMSRDFAAFGIKTGFLTGSMKAAEKRQVLEEVADGTIQILIGTHAVIQPEVSFRNLGLVITDEQHRFGVSQRIKLKDKGESPNVLVMTATPIPRTLAVVLYGDMDVSVIDEMPPGRMPIVTHCLSGEDARQKCYDFVERQIQQGRQAYVVTPLIDESEAMDARSVTQVYEELAARFARTEMIHGAMKQSEKDAIMARFSAGETDVLVSTVVIEVGINVPNATVMVVENAERFGLAQLHQLRGRVGRGQWQSYCFLINEGRSELAEQRGKIMEASSDGFYIAEEDLKLRGPGEIFGTRQHGLPDMKLADMVRHMDVLNAARDEAKALLEEDPRLARPENGPLKRRVEKLFGEDLTLNL